MLQYQLTITKVEARVDERGSLEVSFDLPDVTPIPIKELDDTGSEMSILSFSVFTRCCNITGLTCILPMERQLLPMALRRGYACSYLISISSSFVVVDECCAETFLGCINCRWT